jgi:hypothetical protein
MQDFDRLWDNALPASTEGSYWQATEADWRLPWEAGWERVVVTVRAFGVYESEAVIDGEPWLVTDAVGWYAEHSYVPGTVVHRMPNRLVVAASDGLVLLRNPMREQDS